MAYEKLNIVEQQGLAADGVDIYESLTRAPTVCRTPESAESDEADVLGDAATGYRRVMFLIRYDGEMQSISPKQADFYRNKITKGIYWVIDLEWKIDPEMHREFTAFTEDEMQREEIINQLSSVPNALHKYIKQYFKFNHGIDLDSPDGGERSTVRLAFDKNNYKSKLSR